MKATFRARISDPIGPRWTRWLLPLLALTTMFLDYVWSALDSAAPGPAFYVAAILLLFARPLLGRHRARNCDVTVAPGNVAVSGAGLLNQVIRTHDVSGFSTSVADDGGISLAIARDARMGRPLLIEVRSAVEANELRGALGISRAGLGTLEWTLSHTAFERVIDAARVVGGIIAAYFAVAAVTDDATLSIAWMPFVAAFAVVFLTPLFPSDESSRRGLLRCGERGVFCGLESGVEHVLYTEIDRVEADASTLSITKTNGTTLRMPLRRARHSLSGASELEARHIVAELRDAARRARGEAPASDDTDGTLGVEALMRGDADAPRAWLERLDATAATMGAGYRGTSLTKDALSRALADPDAPPELRVGAARVLYRIAAGETEARVAEICETVRDPSLRKLFRVVLTEDTEEAAGELAEHDAKTRSRARARRG